MYMKWKNEPGQLQIWSGSFASEEAFIESWTKLLVSTGVDDPDAFMDRNCFLAFPDSEEHSSSLAETPCSSSFYAKLLSIKKKDVSNSNSFVLTLDMSHNRIETQELSYLGKFEYDLAAPAESEIAGLAVHQGKLSLIHI